MQIPKPETYRNKKYLAWMRGQPCEVCGALGEPHHVRRTGWGSGVGKKGHDLCVISLCRKCHSLEHAQPFIQDVEYKIINNLMKYIMRTGNGTNPK